MKIVGVMGLTFKPLLNENKTRPLVTSSDTSNTQFSRSKEELHQDYWVFGPCPLSGILKSKILVTDPVSKTLSSLEYRKMENVQNLCNLECHAPVLELLRM
jgi:hypothetical protein